MRISDAARPLALLLAAMTLLSACAGGAPRASADPAVAPAMVIERFLRAANENDLDTMARLFGTTEGAVSTKWPKKEQDERMFIFASVLRHSDYSIGQEQIVPGRRHEAALFMVSMDISQNRVQVPFTVVRAKEHWLIENIDITRVTRGSR
ncbi:MAG TPA: hypothetical protein VK928_07160 [Longimicrobiales bacterium]|nr:hypothetical protein [Longimicrobiales bacterium]